MKKGDNSKKKNRSEAVAHNLHCCNKIPDPRQFCKEITFVSYTLKRSQSTALALSCEGLVDENMLRAHMKV